MSKNFRILIKILYKTNWKPNQSLIVEYKNTDLGRSAGLISTSCCYPPSFINELNNIIYRFYNNLLLVYKSSYART